MEYNFKKAFGDGVFSAKTFNKWMKFIVAYNNAKQSLGSGATEDSIIASITGYSPVEAKDLLISIKHQFTVVPPKEEQTKFMQDYHAYMKQEYAAQRAKVIAAQRAAEEKRLELNGVKYSPKELKIAGEKAKKKVRRSTLSKILCIGIGAMLLGALLPSIAVPLFAGVFENVAVGSAVISATGLAGLVGGGLVGARIYNAGGRSERLANNKALVEFMNENLDVIDMAEIDLETQQAALRDLENEFDLKINDVSGMMESVAFNEVFDLYKSSEEIDETEAREGRVVASSEAEEYEPEPIVTDEAGARRVETLLDEAEEEVVAEEEPEEEVIAEEDPEDEFIEEEIEEDPEDEFIEEEIEEDPEDEFIEEEIEEDPEDEFIEEEIEEDPEEEVPTPEEPTPVEPTPLPAPEEPTPVEPEPTPLTDELIKKKTSVLKAKYSKVINTGCCSPVGQYMLVALRDQAEQNLRSCSTLEEVEETMAIATEEIKMIVADYIKYTSKEGKIKASCLKELPVSEQGDKANETELPEGFEARTDAKTYYSALKRGYVKSSEKLIDGYLHNLGADETISSEIKEETKINIIKEMAESSDFGGIAKALKDHESRINNVRDQVSDRVNKVKSEEKKKAEEEAKSKAEETMVKTESSDEEDLERE